MKHNVFVLGTEYHFLMAMFIIEERFSSDEFQNKLVFLGKRLSQINSSNLPGNVETVEFIFQSEPDPLKKLYQKILNNPVDNLFMVNVYRPADTLIVSSVSKKTRRHLMQDGALFYNRIEKSILGNRLKETYRIYTSLWKKGIPFTDIIWYGRFMETSNYVDEIWMTNPNEYIGPPTRKPVHLINYFPGPNTVQKIQSYFIDHESRPFMLDNYLIYLSPIMRQESYVDTEINQIHKVMAFFALEKVIIKLHPNTPDYHLKKLQKVFGDCVIRNHIPAELYIARAKNSVVIGCASTSLFYNNATNQYFALKGFFQRLGIYSVWHNINLPPHVRQVNELEELGQLKQNV